jgi:hypothetical protein
MSNQKDEKPKQPTPWQVISSVFAAAFGVQSNKNRERDFTQGNPITYIIAGLIFTLLFVLTVYGVVQLILSQVGQ